MAFDSVAEGGAGELVGVCAEEGVEGGEVYFADFAEHPAGGFVDEVVRVVEEDFGDGEGVGEIVLFDEIESAEDGDAFFPERGGVGEFVEDFAVASEEPLAEDAWSGDVNQVPVVYVGGVFQVEIDDGFGGGGVAGFECCFKLLGGDDEGSQAKFVVWRVERFFQFRKRKFEEFFCDLALLGDGEAEELVAFGVLAGAGAEEALEEGGFFGVGVGVEGFSQCLKTIAHELGGCLR